MATIKEEAMAYEPKTTLNIADLEAVPVDLDLYDGEGSDDKGEPFKYKYAVLNEKQYRVPNVVLGEIKKMLKLKPEIKKVKVNKHGSGLSTRYEVEAVD